MDFLHIPVLFNETIESLRVHDGGLYVDGTLGGGGHSGGILKSAENVSLIGIDRDSEAIAAAKSKLSQFGERVTYVNRNFCDVANILTELGIDEIDGMVLDLGVSSYQLDNSERGFSYMQDARLDMRMNRNAQKSAYEVVNEYPREELTRIFYEYGEEKWSAKISEIICEKRAQKPIETTLELVDIIKSAIPLKVRVKGSHPAKRVFQAIRIEVNNELGILDQAVREAVKFLKPGGRLSIITFHSLEDRIIKKTFADLASGCECPKDFPVCVCNKRPEIKIVTRKPVLPSQDEEERNSRAKSAKLRVAEKL